MSGTINTITEQAAALVACEVFDEADGAIGGLIVAIEQARALLDAAQSKLIARFDHALQCRADGFGTTKSWLTQHAQMSGRTAGQRVKVARTLGELDGVRAQGEAGRFSFDQCALFASIHNPRTADAMAADETALIEVVGGLRVDEASKVLGRWHRMADADGPEPDRGYRDRSLFLHSGWNGTWTGQLTLGSADGAILAAAIDRVAEELFAADRRDAELDPLIERTATQRRADALIELIHRANAGAATNGTGATPNSATNSAATSGAGANATPPVASVSLLVPLEDLQAGTGATTDTGAYIHPDGLDRLACNATVTPIGWTIDGVPLSHGRTRRLPTAAQRRAITARDRGCVFPGCDAPPGWCDAHHRKHWARDLGPTDIDNLHLVCHHHHRLLHEGGWELRPPDTNATNARSGSAAGPPIWITPQGRALRNTPGWAAA